MTASVLLITSSGADSAAVVPVLAALEAADVKVRAIDVGAVGSDGSGVGDRLRRAILGESVERRLRREIEAAPPDVAVVFDPYAAIAMTVVRDAAAMPMPVVAVVGALAPGAAWAQTDADRFLAVDDGAAVTLADHGVEAERILVVGAFGEFGFVAAARDSRDALRKRFNLVGRVVTIAICGMSPDVVGQLLLQLSLFNGADGTTFLFDAGSDADAAAVVRRQVPVLGLRGKLFGATVDAPLLWRCADAIVARPQSQTLARALLLGTPLVALVDEAAAALTEQSTALASRRAGLTIHSVLLISGSLETLFANNTLRTPSLDGAANAADAIALVAEQKRAVAEERRLAAAASTRERARAVHAVASSVAAATAVPGELEDLGSADGAAANHTANHADLPNVAQIERLRLEMQQRLNELSAAMMQARSAADRAVVTEADARKRDDSTGASAAERLGVAERARMHALLAEMATVEREIAQLADAAKTAARTSPLESAAAASRSATAAGPRSRLDAELSALKARTVGPGARSTPARAARPVATVDDELDALKRKMAAGAGPGKKK
ncbi:MAG: hypothetical protein KBG15_17945 [Kofleriaceae bacterium]|nr:hypothetical protein [Kofleriaceae bacterium]